MKRVLCFALFLVFVFSFAPSLSENDESAFVGVWFRNGYSNNNTADIELIAIRENHKAYFINAKFYDGQGQNKYDQQNCSWKADGNKIVITHLGRTVRELYLFGDRYLSLFDDGRYENYTLVDDTALVPVLSSGSDPVPFDHDDLFGKWSFYFDVTKLSPEYQHVMDYNVIAYDLYLFDNGSLYFSSMTISKSNDKPEFKPATLGIWVGDPGDMTFLINKNTYKAKISDDGHLLFYMSEKLPFVFSKVDCTDYMSDQLK